MRMKRLRGVKSMKVKMPGAAKMKMPSMKKPRTRDKLRMPGMK